MMTSTNGTVHPQTTPAALFVDYPSLHDAFRRHSGYPDQYIHDLLEALREHLTAQHIHVTRRLAYGEAHQISPYVLKAFYLHGAETCCLPDMVQRNGVDMHLCIDATHMLHTRPDIQTFILITGQNAYMPLVQQLQAFNKHVIVVAPDSSPAESFLRTTGHGTFIAIEHLMRNRRTPEEKVEEREEVTFGEPSDLPYPIDRDVLYIVEKFFGHYDEIYLTPLLRKLSDELGDLDEHDPKSLIGDLEEAGAATLAKRQGFPHDYTVLIVNDEHPAVAEIRQEVLEERTSEDYDTASFDADETPYDAEDEYTEEPESVDAEG